MDRFHDYFTESLYNPDQCELLFTDTDSLMYKVKCQNVYHDLMTIRKSWLDTSNYPQDHPLYETEDTCKLGYFKDEIPPSDSGGVISEFVGLKSKLYSIKTTRNEGCRKRPKGVKKTSLNHITHQDYLTCLFDDVNIPTGDMNFRSYAHKIYTIKCKRTSMHSYDDKRYILEDNIKKLPSGHVSLRTWYKKVFQNLHKYPVVVIENCRDSPLLYTEALMETGHLTSYEKEFYKDLFVLNYVNEINFPVADACFVLSSNPNTCLENIKLRARPGEDHPVRYQ